jgi:hypothetical protein
VKPQEHFQTLTKDTAAPHSQTMAGAIASRKKRQRSIAGRAAFTASTGLARTKSAASTQ